MGSEKEWRLHDEEQFSVEEELREENNWLLKDRRSTVFEFFCFLVCQPNSLEMKWENIELTTIYSSIKNKIPFLRRI
jgi:hypothetical protein